MAWNLLDPDGQFLGWAPGRGPIRSPEGMPWRLEPGTDLTWRSRDGRRLALLQGLPRTAKYPWPQSKISLVDVAGPSVTATVDAAGWTFAERDEERLYLLDPGRPDKNPQKNRNGSIDVVTLADGRVERIDLGRSPVGGALLEGGLVAMASEGPAGGSAGELRLIREGKLVATLPVAARPMYVGREAGSVFVVGAKAVTRVDPASLRVTATIPLVRGSDAIVDDDDRPFELVVTSEGRRAFIHAPRRAPSGYPSGMEYDDRASVMVGGASLVPRERDGGYRRRVECRWPCCPAPLPSLIIGTRRIIWHAGC